MRRFVIIIASILLSAFVSNAQVGPQLEFQDFIIDKGDFPVDQPLQVYDFVITNIGDEPLVIQDHRLACYCMTIYYSKKPIKPGKKGTIRVIYDATSERLGEFKKYAIIQTNVPDHEGLFQMFCAGNMIIPEAL